MQHRLASFRGAAGVSIQLVFGQVLKSLREERGISQQDLAFDADIDRTYVSMLERGIRQPSLQVVFDIAGALNMAPEDLVATVSKKLAK